MSEGSIANTLKNVVTTSPYTIYQTGVLAFVVTCNPRYILFTIVAILFGDVFNAIEKKIAKLLMGSGSDIGKRISGCGFRNMDPRSGKCVGCGIFPAPNSVSRTWGMPSGHAQITSLGAMFWTTYVWHKFCHVHSGDSNEPKPTDWIKPIASTVVLWLLVGVVCFQRVYSQCHSVLQIIVGLVVGSMMGMLGYVLVDLTLLGGTKMFM